MGTGHVPDRMNIEPATLPDGVAGFFFGEGVPKWPRKFSLALMNFPLLRAPTAAFNPLYIKRHMETARQLSIFLDNKPGTLAEVCGELANQKINIYAMSVSDTTDHSVVRLVVSDSQKALYLLEERGALVVENNVLLLENANKPGAMATIAHKLAKAKINIEYAYLATSPSSKKGLAVLRVSDTKKALKVLEGI